MKYISEYDDSDFPGNYIEYLEYRLEQTEREFDSLSSRIAANANDMRNAGDNMDFLVERVRDSVVFLLKHLERSDADSLGKMQTHLQAMLKWANKDDLLKGS